MRPVTLLLLLLITVACAREAEQPAEQRAAPAPEPIGHAGRGRELIARHGCNVCHAVPGVEGPQGSLGPTLAGIGSRPAISFGTVKNTPENLAQFIRDPASLNPQTSMPGIGLPVTDAQDIAAYLLTLK